MDRYKQSLLKTAGDVHSTATGAMERSQKDQDRDVAFLEYRIERWEAPLSFTVEFDAAVLTLCKIALKEAKNPQR